MFEIIDIGCNLKQFDVEADRKKTKIPTIMKFLSLPKNENESRLSL